MGLFPECVKCPICLNVPSQEIFQCKNGHMLCHICATKLSACPQCRLEFEDEKIRNRSLEVYLDTMKYNCVYKSDGCKKEKTRQTLSEHEKNCRFGGPKLQLCKQLGLDCEFTIRTWRKIEAFAHFQSHINCTRVLRNGEVYAETYKLENIDRSASSIWELVFVELSSFPKSTFMFLITYNKSDQTISPICLRIPHDDDPCELFISYIRVEFVIKAVKHPDFPHLVWNTSPMELRHAEFALKHPTIRVPLDHIISHYTQDSSLKVGFSMFNTFINIAAKLVKSAQPICALM